MWCMSQRRKDLVAVFVTMAFILCALFLGGFVFSYRRKFKCIKSIDMGRYSRANGQRESQVGFSYNEARDDNEIL